MKNNIKPIRYLAVFCGADTGQNPIYQEEAKALARELATRHIGLVYGGSNIGLMRQLADTMLELNQPVIGVIPQSLVDFELAHPGITEQHIVTSLHERKAMLKNLADGFILFPGGIGSLDEFFDLFSQKALGLHDKPCGILNINGYFNHLIEFLKHSTKEGFIKPFITDLVLIASSARELINKMSSYTPPKYNRYNEPKEKS